MKIHQRTPSPRVHTRLYLDAKGEDAVTEPRTPDEVDARTALTESILDNLSAWAVVAFVIGVLYLVWATLAVLDRYVGDIPAVGV
jgi:hypothetical protein